MVMTSLFGAGKQIAANPAAAVPPNVRATSAEGVSAKATLAATFRQYGLPESLVDVLWGTWYVNEGRPITQILIDMEETSEYKQRFPGIATLKERRNRGEAVIVPTAGQYIALEAGIGSVLRDAGLPPGLYDDPTDFAKWIGGSVSPKEVEDRIGYARTVAFSMPVETREELARIYGMDQGELIGYVLDPARGLEAVQKRVLGAGIGGAAKRVGWELLTQQEMEQLAASGTTEAAAGERFGQLEMMGEGLFAETAGEATTEEDLGRATQIGFAGGSAAAERQMTSRRQRRAAQFQGGGGAAGGGEGKTGLG